MRLTVTGVARSRSASIDEDRLETWLIVVAMLGFVVLSIWIASPAFALVDYPLHPSPLVAGSLCFVLGLWLFFRSHADLGTNWSVTLEVREGHRLITQGVYRRIRHPMYAALFCLLARADPRGSELDRRGVISHRVRDPVRAPRPL